MTEREKMIAGELYDASDEQLATRRTEAHNLCTDYNRTYETEQKKRGKILGKLLPNAKPGAYIQGPFYCDYGDNIAIGENFYANFNFTVLDCCPVEIGDDVFIGPNVSLLTPVHPFRWQQRNMRKKADGTAYDLEYAKPIKIGKNCWLAGNVTVIGGVTIGEGCVIGAGSVVTRDIPANSLAVGNPCRVIRQITDKDELKELIDGL
ncbi:MAG: sugar O-acetyltransferase [Clostridia bacterium]|nr:sugar O-acetyltransferase [Clostridia bacterium]